MKPTEAAHRVADDRSVAVVSTGGVELLTRMGAWTGEPDEFEDIVPVLITITNEGETALRIRHADFTLVSTSGTRTRGIAPFKLRRVELTAVDTSISPDSALGYSPVYWPFGFHSVSGPKHTGFGRFGGLFGGFGPGHRVGAPYQPDSEIVLPTTDMIANALLEQSVEPGEQATGFVFFAKPAGDLDDVRVEVDLVAVDVREAIASIDGLDAGIGRETPAAY